MEDFRILEINLNFPHYGAKPSDSSFDRQRMKNITHGREATPSELHAIVYDEKSSRRRGDFVALYGALGFNSRVHEMFTDQGFRGWSSYNLVLWDRGEQLDERWFGLLVTGVPLPHDETQGMIWSANTSGKKKVVGMNGLYFDSANWDGSDFFHIGTFGAILITPRVESALKKLGAKGWRTISPLQYNF